MIIFVVVMVMVMVMVRGVILNEVKWLARIIDDVDQ